MNRARSKDAAYNESQPFNCFVDEDLEGNADGRNGVMEDLIRSHFPHRNKLTSLEKEESPLQSPSRRIQEEQEGVGNIFPSILGLREAEGGMDMMKGSLSNFCSEYVTNCPNPNDECTITLTNLTTASSLQPESQFSPTQDLVLLNNSRRICTGSTSRSMTTLLNNSGVCYNC